MHPDNDDMELFVTAVGVGGVVVLATRWFSSSAVRRHGRPAAGARAGQTEVARVRGDGPDPAARPRAQDRTAAADDRGGAADPALEELPLSLEFLPEAGGSPPVTEDIFARLAQRRMDPDADR